MPLVTPWSKALCPFCFNRFHLSAAHLRYNLSEGNKEPDIQVAKFLSMNSAPQLGAVDTRGARTIVSRLFRRIFVPNDHGGKTLRICPKCHMNLPNATATGQLSSEIIAIVGARSSGKSNYFGVLLKNLETRYADEVDFTIYDQSTFSVNEMRPISSKLLYRQRYGNRLYSDSARMAVDQSRSAQQDVDLRIPLIYRLEFRKRWQHYLSDPFKSVNPMDLVIFDAAGEDLQDQITVEQYCSYILSASGIIFVIDPFQFEGVRNLLDPELEQRYPKVEIGPAEIVSRVIELFETRGRLAAGQRVPLPVAVAFSKSDGLKDLMRPDGRRLVHPTSAINRDSHHDHGFNEDDSARLSEEIIECIRQWEDPGLVKLVTTKFKTSRFFAMSALGQLPAKNDLRINKVSPLRIADPLLWLLHQRGYIPKSRK